jgi:hypothetical protein
MVLESITDQDILSAFEEAGFSGTPTELGNLLTTLRKTLQRTGQSKPTGKIQIAYRNVVIPIGSNGTLEFDFTLPQGTSMLEYMGIFRQDTNVQEFNIGLRWPNEQIFDPHSWRAFDCNNIQIASKRYRDIQIIPNSERLILQVTLDAPTVAQIQLQALIGYKR